MARASTVYAVMYSGADRVEPRMGFTVKHELITWLKKQPPEDLIWLHIYQFPDGTATYGSGQGPSHKFPSDFIGD